MDTLAIDGTSTCLHRSILHLTDSEIHEIRQAVYKSGIVVLKEQTASAAEFVRFGHRMGDIRPYYEAMYRHLEHDEIFVSSNVQTDGKANGVPRTGKFWHSDYAFMSQPFAFTMTYPQIVSSQNRGTYFIDMADAYRRLSAHLKTQLIGAKATHSVRRYFKIRPSDVYRPIGEVLAEVDRNTPQVEHPAVIRHPVTRESILYVSRGFTEALTLADADADADAAAILHELLVESGQMDDTFTHPGIKLLNISEGDIIIWDNRRFVHHAKHSEKIEPAKTFRLTGYDEFAFSAQAAGTSRETEGLSHA
ncbi:TauD/TfdA dioxygenase family protein [Burkholderia sp. TSV86]|uniref:TauD/TfdA dioxygenase family protein n=1 Tax=Burkholderia sp. TSV86 TaxID=1385594 RepID=UPI00075EB4EE|nr:TauD/TfdA family dioxygenase [Burkholderia sp. TSV86]KVE32645.1 taurine catabolism dioxygenase [Burkholderia sp. TSV86]